jgi:hypothetical protein
MLLDISTASFAEEAARQMAGRDSGFCTEPHSGCCVITQPPYCLDFALNYFWLFSTFKKGLNRICFTAMEDKADEISFKILEHQNPLEVLSGL